VDGSNEELLLLPSVSHAKLVRSSTSSNTHIRRRTFPNARGGQSSNPRPRSIHSHREPQINHKDTSCDEEPDAEPASRVEIGYATRKGSEERQSHDASSTLFRSHLLRERTQWGGREKQSQDGKDEKGERQTTWREAQPGEAETFFGALRLTGMWDGSLAKCSTSTSALRGRKQGANFGYSRKGADVKRWRFRARLWHFQGNMGCSLPELKHGLKNKQFRAGLRKGALIFNVPSQICLFVSSRIFFFGICETVDEEGVDSAVG
jgi:hypothetical protein